jgi:hypothetical protein
MDVKLKKSLSVIILNQETLSDNLAKNKREKIKNGKFKNFLLKEMNVLLRLCLKFHGNPCR